MKKFILLALALVLGLAGCNVAGEEEMTQYSLGEFIDTFNAQSPRNFISRELKSRVVNDLGADRTFGSAIAISANGKKIVVGNDEAASGNGQSFIYDLFPGGIDYVVQTDLSGSFGESVAVSSMGEYIVIGAETVNSNDGGATFYKNNIYDGSVLGSAGGANYFGSDVAAAKDWGGAPIYAIRERGQIVVKFAGVDYFIPCDLNASGSAVDSNMSAPIRISADGRTILTRKGDVGLDWYLYVFNFDGANWIGSQLVNSYTSQYSNSYDMSDDGLTVVAVRDDLFEIHIFERTSRNENFTNLYHVITSGDAGYNLVPIDTVSVSGDGKQILLGFTSVNNNQGVVVRFNKKDGQWIKKEDMASPNPLDGSRFGRLIDQDYYGKNLLISTQYNAAAPFGDDNVFLFSSD